MARAYLLPVAALFLLAASVGASRNLQQSSTANPPSSAFGGPKVTIDPSITPPAGNTVKINWRAVGTQNYTSASNSQYVSNGAVANFFLQNGTTVVGKHFFIPNNGGISPVFTRTDPQGNTIGTCIGSPIANVSAPNTNDNGGYGSIPFVLQQAIQADGFFAGVTFIQRINTLGGVVPGNPKLFTLPASPTGVANFQLAVPYQADYLFFVGGSPASG